jgi:hypothetical protein
VSAPALINKYLNQQASMRAWIMENSARTGALMISGRGALLKPWLKYSGGCEVTALGVIQKVSW